MLGSGIYPLVLLVCRHSVRGSSFCVLIVVSNSFVSGLSVWFGSGSVGFSLYLCNYALSGLSSKSNALGYFDFEFCVSNFLVCHLTYLFEFDRWFVSRCSCHLAVQRDQCGAVKVSFEFRR